jgi:hypothetical protein
MTRAPEAGQAGAEEIEITSEMIRQGVFALLDGNVERASPSWIVEQVYRAMRRLEPAQTRRPSHQVSDSRTPE